MYQILICFFAYFFFLFREGIFFYYLYIYIYIYIYKKKAVGNPAICSFEFFFFWISNVYAADLRVRVIAYMNNISGMTRLLMLFKKKNKNSTRIDYKTSHEQSNHIIDARIIDKSTMFTNNFDINQSLIKWPTNKITFTLIMWLDSP
jgi:hypothetical protein